MDTSTEASTTSRYCSSCKADRQHRNRVCTACGFRDDPWPAGPGVAPHIVPNNPWAA